MPQKQCRKRGRPHSKAALARHEQEGSNRRSMSFVQPRTWQATAILVLAMLMSFVWNKWLSETIDPTVRGFLSKMCKLSSCHAYLSPTRRTQRASRDIAAGQRLLTIPKNHTIWDIDALRNDWIRKELFADESVATTTSGAAYLAVFLARLFGGHEQSFDEAMNDYIHSVLPTTIDDFRYHPILWPDLDDLLRGTYTYDRVVAVRQLIETEYKTFQQRSPAFSTQVSLEAYEVARLNVLTRSFGTGTPTEYDPAEVKLYKQQAGVDVSKGSHAMVPILDLYDHHAKPNVGFSYRQNEEAFVIESLRLIAADHELFDSYGKRTDSDLFAKYGFVNGDGSEHTDASIALWHNTETTDPVDPKTLLRYLQYDDGYADCVSQKDHHGWALKELKFRYIKHWALQPRRWVARMPPRNTSSLPVKRSNQPITNQLPPAWDMSRLQFDGSWLFSSCRLLSLTHLDYDGQAREMLETHVANATFLLPPTKDALEFRTLMCVARMTQTALQKMNVSLFPTNATFQSPEWIAAHIRLGESQVLNALKQTSFAGLQVFRDKINSSPEFSMRDQPCGPKVLVPLLKKNTPEST